MIPEHDWSKYLWWDLETRSKCDLKEHGSALYARDESTQTILFCYAYGDDEPQIVDLLAGEQLPFSLVNDLTNPAWIKAGFNSIPFDSEVWEQEHGIYIPTEQQADILMRARRYGLGMKLGSLCRVLGVDDSESKDASGKDWIKLFSNPLPANSVVRRKTGKDFNDFETHPAEWGMFKGYGKGDISAVRACAKKLPTWNDTPFADRVIAVDRIINRRGIMIDREYVIAAARLVSQMKNRIKGRIEHLTGGIKAGSHKKFRAWIQQRMPGIPVKGTSKDVIAELIEEHRDAIAADAALSEVFSLLGMANSSSISKYAKMLAYAAATDDRMYWLIKYCGAGVTGRWAGAGPQPHNYPRPLHPEWVIDAFIAAAQNGMAEGWENALKVAVSSLRAAMIPAPGYKFVNSDFSSVEGRVLGWVAGEQLVMDAYREGKNLYLMNGEIFGIPYDQMSKKHKLYMVCKVIELSMGYQGGVGAFVSMAKNYGLDLDKLAQDLHDDDLVPEKYLHQANKLYHNPRFRKQVKSTGLSHFTWVYIDAIKRMWREKRPQTKMLWNKLDECVRMALDNPNVEFTCGHKGMISVEYDGGDYLGIRLPSGRILTYLWPKISGRKSADKELAEKKAKKEKREFSEEQFEEDYDGDDRDTIISYWAPTEKGLQKQYVHGGKFTNNVVQGIAADLMAHCLVHLEDQGWPIVLHVHDQALAELKKSDSRGYKDLERDMCQLPDWASNDDYVLPMEAEGEELERFAK